MTDYRAAAATDAGKVRAGNEDSFHRGDAVFAVADGMGGHVAGEVASNTALGPVADLDGKVFPDGPAAVAALRQAVVEANITVAEKARGEPSYRGMGTTLTAVMVEGRRLHLAHVGDSRAYLLRNGELTQITTDHTLVQHLIDEGQITAEEASTHPQRSIITRAIGVSLEVDVDTLSLDVQPGDEVVLCSDGLSGPVSDAEIARTLAAEPDAQRAVDRLVEMANDAGGPDNITVVLLRFEPEGGFPTVPTDADGDGGSADDSEDDEDPSPSVIRTTSSTGGGTWAEALGRLGAGRDADSDDVPRRPRRSQRLTAAVVVTVLLVGAAIGGGRWLLSRSYYVGADGGQVVIYQGVPATIGPLELHWVAERTSVDLTDLPAFLADDLRAGRAAVSLADARNIVLNLRVQSGAEPQPPVPSPGPSGSATPRATTSPAPSPTTAP